LAYGVRAPLALCSFPTRRPSDLRHGSKDKAEKFFLAGMTRAIHSLAEQAHPAFPVTIYYAFKQSETSEGSTVSTGWVTFLEAVRSEEHTSELQSRENLVCRLLLE